jgi:hypothetical protein
MRPRACYIARLSLFGAPDATARFDDPYGRRGRAVAARLARSGGRKSADHRSHGFQRRASPERMDRCFCATAARTWVGRRPHGGFLMKVLRSGLIITAAFASAPFFAMPSAAMPVSNLAVATSNISTLIEHVGDICGPYGCSWPPSYYAPGHVTQGIYPCRRPGWYGQGQGWCGHWNGLELYGGWFRGRWYGGWVYTGSWRYREGW